jgi:Arc/MetJ-type ribon-helix-helix transcriptional regulator
MGRPQIERHKIKTSITIDPELYTWVQSKIETKEFSNLTHAIERGLILLREKLEEKKR